MQFNQQQQYDKKTFVLKKYLTLKTFLKKKIEVH